MDVDVYRDDHDRRWEVPQPEIPGARARAADHPAEEHAPALACGTPARQGQEVADPPGQPAPLRGGDAHPRRGLEGRRPQGLDHRPEDPRGRAGVRVAGVGRLCEGAEAARLRQDPLERPRQEGEVSPAEPAVLHRRQPVRLLGVEAVHQARGPPRNAARRRIASMTGPKAATRPKARPLANTAATSASSGADHARAKRRGPRRGGPRIGVRHQGVEAGPEDRRATRLSRTAGRRALLNVGRLLLHPLQDALHLDHPRRDGVLRGLAADGVDLPVELLDEELELAPDGPLGGEGLGELAAMGQQPRELFGDVGLVGEDRGLLGEARRIELLAQQPLEALVELVPQALVEAVRGRLDVGPAPLGASRWPRRSACSAPSRVRISMRSVRAASMAVSTGATPSGRPPRAPRGPARRAARGTSERGMGSSRRWRRLATSCMARRCAPLAPDPGGRSARSRRRCGARRRRGDPAHPLADGGGHPRLEDEVLPGHPEVDVPKAVVHALDLDDDGDVAVGRFAAPVAGHGIHGGR